ncbi:MAG: DUF4129 domain-containing protein [Dehalococcoidia bacterium]|nr:DUF4129 domain-containing protein [Dehalococcoidia bacterium]
MLLGATAGVAALGVLVVWVVFGLLGDALGNIASNVIVAVLTVIFTPIVWLVDTVLSFLLGGGGATQSPADSQLPEGPPTIDAESGDGGLPEEAAFAWRLLLLLGLGAAGVAAIVVVTHLRRRSQQQRQAPADVASAGSFSGDLRSLFGNIFGRRGPGQDVTGEGAIRLYTEMLREAEHRGQRRQAGQTPVELLPSLASTFPRAPVDEITRVFDDARYGDHPPDPAELDELRRRWEAGRETGET